MQELARGQRCVAGLARLLRSTQHGERHFPGGDEAAVVGDMQHRRVLARFREGLGEDRLRRDCAAIRFGVADGANMQRNCRFENAVSLAPCYVANIATKVGWLDAKCRVSQA